MAEATTDRIHVELVTPDKRMLREDVLDVSLPGREGYLGILPGHAPLISELAVGEITYKNEGGTHYLSVAWGFAEVLPDKVTILAETAERPEEIDVKRAEGAKKRAEDRLQSGNAEVDFERATEALERAETRLEVAEKK